MAAIEIQGQVGPGTYTDGTVRTARLDKEGGLVVAPGLAEYARRGLLYTGMTAVTGIAPGTTIGTTPAIAIGNPVGSGKTILIMVVTCGYVSGTLGAGIITYCANKPASAHTLTSGTAIVPYNSKGNTSIANIVTGGTLSVAPGVVRPFASLQASLASTAVAPWTLKDEPMGEIAIEPGGIISLQATAAAGSTPLVAYGITWVELVQ